MSKSNENEIAKLEHDNLFHVKKTGLFVDNEDGTLVRQTKIATEEKQDSIIAKMPTLTNNGSVPTIIPVFNLEGFETTSGFTGSADVTNITNSTDHRGIGQYSISFDKSGTTQNYALVEKTFTSKNVEEFTADHDIVWALNLPSITNISVVYLAVGSSILNCMYYQVNASDLVVGWNCIRKRLCEPFSQIGNGIDYSNVTWIGVYVSFNSTSNTLSGIKIDNIEFHPTNTQALLEIKSKMPTEWGYCADSLTATYQYYFFEDKSLNYKIMRETLATGVYSYAKGTGGYTSVYVNKTSDPTGSPTFGTYGETF
jgi:hypothetical protein